MELHGRRLEGHGMYTLSPTFGRLYCPRHVSLPRVFLMFRMRTLRTFPSKQFRSERSLRLFKLIQNVTYTVELETSLDTAGV